MPDLFTYIAATVNLQAQKTRKRPIASQNQAGLLSEATVPPHLGRPEDFDYAFEIYYDTASINRLWYQPSTTATLPPRRRRRISNNDLPARQIRFCKIGCYSTYFFQLAPLEEIGKARSYRIDQYETRK